MNVAQRGLTVLVGGALVAMSAAALVAVLRRMSRDAAFRAALARPGRPGTLQDRLTSGRTRRACRGKTGTLPSGGVSALAGYCTTRKGRRLAFAVLARDASPPTNTQP